MIKKNTYAGNLASVVFGNPDDVRLEPRDVWLASRSADILVKEKRGTVVLDEGVGNTVLLGRHSH